MKYIRLAAFTFAVAVTISGCSVFGGSASSPRKKDKKQTETVVKKVAGAKTDLAKVIDGEWTIETVGSTRIVRDEDMPYVFFDTAESTFYASNGCNVLNGVFSIVGDRLTFSNVLSTMRYCADTPYDAEISALLADGRTVVVRYGTLASEGVIVLADDKGHQLMTLRHHAMAFLNGDWQVVEINGEGIDRDDMTVFIDMAEGRIHGNTGCNYFNGDIRVEPGETNAVSFAHMGVTQRMCENADLERRMLVALEETALAVDGGDGTALLTSRDGRTNLKIKRIPVR